MMQRTSTVAAGFTLLEVLVAMTILSTVAVFIVRLCGDSQSRLGETQWRDTMSREGRNKMIELVLETPEKADLSNLNQWGTLAPRYPEVQWKSSIQSVDEFHLYRMTFRCFDETARREVVLERFFLRPEKTGKPTS